MNADKLIRAWMLAALLACVAGPPLFTHGARILAVQTVPAKSHWNFLGAVLRALTAAGHHVTAFTSLSDGRRENYTEVDTSGTAPQERESDVLAMLDAAGTAFSFLRLVTGVNRRFCDTLYGDPQLADMMARAAAGHVGGGSTQFDVVLVEPFGVDCVSHLARVLDVPVVYVIPSPMITFAERAFTGHTSNPAYVAHLLAQNAAPVTFVQRLANAALAAFSALVVACYQAAARAADPKPYDFAPAVSPSVIFQNSHHATEAPRPVLPNVVDVGGIHLRPPERLPQDILNFIEDSPHGVIYFTFGSLIRLSSLPEHIEKAFRRALERVPQRVLWKYEGEMADKPKNVMTRKWFPQRDVLLHPKVKLFISHGGMSGVYEAVDAGVPVLGFPLIYDQPRNIEHLVRNGMAVSMDLMTVTDGALFNAISELVNDKKYTKNAKINSALFKDRPMSPEQTVVYWTEYVVRHKGASHLKPQSVHLMWYQYFTLDVIAVMLITIWIVVFIAYKVIIYAWNL